ncbi:MAG: hypothetical protein ACTSQY_09280 [Candidatus Odinarchaeia archaeon]
MSEINEIELPRSSYDTFTSIIQAFLPAKGDEQAVSSKEIASYAGRHPTLIGQNIKAIIFLGIATREEGYTYKLTLEGANLAYSLEYNDEEGVSAAFRSLILKNNFLTSLIYTVKNRGNITNYTLRDEIAKRAKVTKNDIRATTGSQTIIDILIVSNFLIKEGDNIEASNRVSELLKEEKRDLSASFEIKPKQKVYVRPTEKDIPLEIQIRLNFEIPINPVDSDVEEIINTIKKIKNSLLNEKMDDNIDL